MATLRRLQWLLPLLIGIASCGPKTPDGYVPNDNVRQQFDLNYRATHFRGFMKVYAKSKLGFQQLGALAFEVRDETLKNLLGQGLLASCRRSDLPSDPSGYPIGMPDDIEIDYPPDAAAHINIGHMRAQHGPTFEEAWKEALPLIKKYGKADGRGPWPEDTSGATK